ncbi:hypothetical protein LCL95_09245 [Bacillus timonensis]|nr:hypothetical protein [Bacillus timonensis]
MSKEKDSKIPKLELEKFDFSPPGPMGWSFSEYEKMLEDPSHIVLDESAVKDKLKSLNAKQLVELPLDSVPDSSSEETSTYTLPPLTATAEKADDEITLTIDYDIAKMEKEKKDKKKDVKPVEEKIEEVEEVKEVEEVAVEKPEEKRKRVKIVIVDPGIKGPWISPMVTKKRK